MIHQQSQLGGDYMREDLERRAEEIAVYLVEHVCTIREAAGKFGVSKSTVHKDLSVRLRSDSRPLYDEVRLLLESNMNERHIRGGEATKRKYLALKRHEK